MILNCLNDVAELHGLQALLCLDDMEIVEGYEEVAQVACVLLEGSRMSEGALVVGDWPLWGAHHSQVVVAVGVQTAQESVLGGEALLGD